MAACAGVTPSQSGPASQQNVTPTAVVPPTATPAPQPTKAPMAIPRPAPTKASREPPPEATPTEAPANPTPEMSPAEPAPQEMPYSVSVYEGNGFSIFYPPGTEIGSTKVGVVLLGPDIAVRPAEADWVYQGPAYTLVVDSFNNPEGVDIDTWTRQFLLESWQFAKEKGAPPPEMFPVTEDGRIVEDALHTVLVRGQPAVFVEHYAFGILEQAFYVACPDRVVVLEFQFRDEFAAGTDPLTALQQDIYALLKDGLWCGGAGTEPPSLLTALGTSAPDETPYANQVYMGADAPFGLAYPPHAQVVPSKTGGMTILGPEVVVHPADAGWTYTGPAYALDIATFEMENASAGYEAETWAREHLMQRWREEKQQGAPTGSLPVSEDGVIEESRVGVTLLNGEPAFWVQYLNPDAAYRAFYLRCGDRIVQLGFSEELLPNQPLAELQRDLYSLMLNTFECTSQASLGGMPARGETVTLNVNPAQHGVSLRGAKGHVGDVQHFERFKIHLHS